MASNGEIEAEDTEINENNGEKVVTMMDVLKEQEDFEEDANAVLGASDDKNCTYALGYIKRQAIYACMTCCTEAKEDPTKRAGVCLACSLTCHENHELIELYTKRNFRCDCGNPKFNSHPCQFTPNKTDLNEENSYNQNFSGVYCVCHRPYPDPEASEEDEMIQCIMCEDWLHANHLEATVPSAQYAEMICKDCMQKNEFIHDYTDLALNTENDYVDVVSLNNSSLEKNGFEENNQNEGDNENITGQSSIGVVIPQEKSDIIEDNSEITEPKLLVEKEEENAMITNDNSTTLSDANDQTESNSTVDANNAECSTMKAQQETETDTNIDTPSESKNITSENVMSENDVLVVRNNDIDSHINALKEVVEFSEELSKEVNSEGSNEEKNKDSILGNIEPNLVTAQPTVNDPNAGESTEMEISNEPDDKVIDEKSSDAGSNTILPQNLEDSNKESINESDNNSNTGTEINTSPIQDNKSTNENSTSEKPKDVTQTIETSNILNNSESDKKSEEELEEDKLLADPDESNQNEISVKEVSNTDAPDKSNDLNNSSSDTPNTHVATNAVQEIKQDKQTKNNVSYDTIIDNSAHSSENVNTISGSTTKSIDTETEGTNEKPEIKRKLSVESTDSEAKKRKVGAVECKRPKNNKRQCKGATFWPSHFRQKLCTCSECLSMYKDLSVLFILDPEDTVTAYENLGKEKSNGKPQSQYEKGLQALSSLDRIQQINVLTEYNKMRDKFLDFLKSFKDRRKIVTEDDVKAFFAGMKPTKRPDGVYFCR